MSCPQSWRRHQTQRPDPSSSSPHPVVSLTSPFQQGPFCLRLQKGELQVRKSGAHILMPIPRGRAQLIQDANRPQVHSELPATPPSPGSSGAESISLNLSLRFSLCGQAPYLCRPPVSASEVKGVWARFSSPMTFLFSPDVSITLYRQTWVSFSSIDPTPSQLHRMPQDESKMLVGLPVQGGAETVAPFSLFSSCVLASEPSSLSTPS